MVTAHNAWSTFPEILVSLYGWIALVKGAMLLTFPDMHRQFIKKVNNDEFLNFTGLFYVLLGAYVLYTAFA